jgi:hypothetical protein
MRALVVYESMYGNTHEVAAAIAEGLRPIADVRAVPVHEATAALAQGTDLLIVGGPTHAHAMTRASTRKAAMDAAAKSDSGLTVDPDAPGLGVRDWLDTVGELDVRGAAFDTRLDARAWLTGRASKGIARKLRQRGCALVVEPESFLVTKENELVAGEAARASAWGATLAAQLAPTP